MNSPIATLAQAFLASVGAAFGSSRPPHRIEDIQPSGAERRTEARYPTQDPAELEVLPGSDGPIYGTVVDVSRSGLRVVVSQHIDTGKRVRVKLHHNVIFGEIRYCHPLSGGFQVGIRIEDLVRSARADSHLAEDPLSLFAVGKGLSVPEVIEVREHLSQCKDCRRRLAVKERSLKAALFASSPSGESRPPNLQVKLPL